MIATPMLKCFISLRMKGENMKGLLRAVFNKDARKSKDELFLKHTKFYEKLSAWDKCCIIEQIQAELQKEYDKNSSLYYSNIAKVEGTVIDYRASYHAGRIYEKDLDRADRARKRLRIRSKQGGTTKH